MDITYLGDAARELILSVTQIELDRPCAKGKETAG